MSTIQKKLPHFIKLIEEVDTIIFEQNILENGSRQSSGVYKINDEIVGDKRIARLTPEDQDNNQERNFTIKADDETVIIKAAYANLSRFGNTLHIQSPSGFLVGSVRDRHFKCKVDKEICTANQDVVFLLTHSSHVSDVVIKIKHKTGEDVVARVSSSIVQNEKVIHSIINSKHIQNEIPALQKLLLLCAVMACCQQNQTWLQSIYDFYCKVKDRVCCRLYYDRKCLFWVLCFSFPLVIIIYFILVLFFVTYIVGSLFISLCCFYLCGDGETVFSCFFNWPCRLCNNENCTGPKEINDPHVCIIHVSFALFAVFPWIGILIYLTVAFS